jgi:hypothetical protein
MGHSWATQIGPGVTDQQHRDGVTELILSSSNSFGAINDSPRLGRDARATNLSSIGRRCHRWKTITIHRPEGIILTSPSATPPPNSLPPPLLTRLLGTNSSGAAGNYQRRNARQNTKTSRGHSSAAADNHAPTGSSGTSVPATQDNIPRSVRRHRSSSASSHAGDEAPVGATT